MLWASCVPLCCLHRHFSIREVIVVKGTDRLWLSSPISPPPSVCTTSSALSLYYLFFAKIWIRRGWFLSHLSHSNLFLVPGFIWPSSVTAGVIMGTSCCMKVRMAWAAIGIAAGITAALCFAIAFHVSDLFKNCLFSQSLPELPRGGANLAYWMKTRASNCTAPLIMAFPKSELNFLCRPSFKMFCCHVCNMWSSL